MGHLHRGARFLLSGQSGLDGLLHIFLPVIVFASKQLKDHLNWHSALWLKLELEGAQLHLTRIVIRKSRPNLFFHRL